MTKPIACENETKVRAASIVYNEKGEIAGRYDKIHLFDVNLSATEVYNESDTVESGDKVIVIDTLIGKLGIAVCYDLRFPELFRALVNKGAEIIAIPAAFTVKTGEAHWELLTRCRAVENFCYAIGACQGGTHDSGRKTYGNSIIVDPWGSIISKLEGTKSGVIYASIDHEHLKEIRRAIPSLDHQKI